MKRLLNIILFLFLSVYLSGQIVTTNVYFTAVSDTLGPEMIREGTFASSTYWTLEAVWSITTGTPGYATYNDVASGNLRQTNANMLSTVTVNTLYRLTFTIGSYTPYMRILNGNVDETYVDYAYYAPGNWVVRFTTPANIGADAGISFRATTGADGAFTITNISLKKVL
jgi:hypothetical protein